MTSNNWSIKTTVTFREITFTKSEVLPGAIKQDSRTFFFAQNNMGQSRKLISGLEGAKQVVSTLLKFYANSVKQS